MGKLYNIIEDRQVYGNTMSTCSEAGLTRPEAERALCEHFCNTLRVHPKCPGNFVPGMVATIANGDCDWKVAFRMEEMIPIIAPCLNNELDTELRDAINRLWYTHRDEFGFILRALYARDYEELDIEVEGVSLEDMQKNWEEYAQSYLSVVASDKVLQLIIDFIDG